MSKEKKERSQLKSCFQYGDERKNDSFCRVRRCIGAPSPGALSTCARDTYVSELFFIFIISSKEFKIELMHIKHLESISTTTW